MEHSVPNVGRLTDESPSKTAGGAVSPADKAPSGQRLRARDSAPYEGLGDHLGLSASAQSPGLLGVDDPRGQGTVADASEDQWQLVRRKARNCRDRSEIKEESKIVLWGVHPAEVDHRVLKTLVVCGVRQPGKAASGPEVVIHEGLSCS